MFIIIEYWLTDFGKIVFLKEKKKKSILNII